MPKLVYKGLVHDKRFAFMEAMLALRDAPEFTYKLGEFEADMISFVRWANSGDDVPEERGGCVAVRLT